MTTNVDVQALVDALPDPDNNGFIREIDAETTERTLERMADAACPVASRLVDMLRDPEEGGDEKVRYGLHALIVYAARTDNEPLRRTLVEAMGGALLDEDRPVRVKQFLAQQLQVCGRQESIPALSQLLMDEELCEAATQALLSIGEEAVEPIRSALRSAPDHCRRTLAQAAGVLRDRHSAETLRELLDDEDVDMRLTAGWGLANMADPGSIELLMKAAEVPYSYERIKATDHLLTLAENLTADGQEDDARHIYRHLERTRLDPQEKHIRATATVRHG